MFKVDTVIWDLQLNAGSERLSREAVLSKLPPAGLLLPCTEGETERQHTLIGFRNPQILELSSHDADDSDQR